MRRDDRATTGASDRESACVRVSLGALLCAIAFLAVARGGVAQAAARSPLPVSVSVSGTPTGPAVPADFLGLSFELSSLHQIAGYAEDGDLVTLLRSLGQGVLRFGGVSADTQVAWTDEATPRPSWASSTLEEGDLHKLSELAEESGWHVLLTLGLGHYEPIAAAREAAAAKAQLGGWLAGIELGNEPNAYAQHGLREEPWTFPQYDEEVAAYRSAIETAAPGIPLAGPDVSGSSAFEPWGLGEAIDQRPALLTGHHYPLGCEERPPPTIARLLSPLIRRKEGISLLHYLSIAEASQIPFRLDETNTVSCGGLAGISNTFASALWAVSYLTQAMSMGVAGINLHGNPANCGGYAPVCAPTPEDLASGVLRAQPEWYALLLAKALIGDRPLRTTITSPGPLNVAVTTLLAPDGALHVVVVDDELPGGRTIALRLRLDSRFRRASVLSLTAPSPTALAGVRLGGSAVSSAGSWSAPATLPHALSHSGVITVDIAPSSAALLTVPSSLS